MENPSEAFPNIVRWMVAGGYSDAGIQKVVGGNVLRVNVTSLFNWAHAVLPHMLASRQGGRIVNNSSVSGKQGGDENSVNRAAYAAAKAGVLGFTRGLAREVAPKVTVNAVCPGLILNPRTTKLWEAKPDMHAR